MDICDGDTLTSDSGLGRLRKMPGPALRGCEKGGLASRALKNRKNRFPERGARLARRDEEAQARDNARPAVAERGFGASASHREGSGRSPV